MQTALENGNLIISIPVNGQSLKELPMSSSGKTRIVASSHGNAPTTVQIDGKPVVVGLNAFVKHNG